MGALALPDGKPTLLEQEPFQLAARDADRPFTDPYRWQFAALDEFVGSGSWELQQLRNLRNLQPLIHLGLFACVHAGRL
jgi:hypothetical protein